MMTTRSSSEIPWLTPSDQYYLAQAEAKRVRKGRLRREHLARQAQGLRLKRALHRDAAIRSLTERMGLTRRGFQKRFRITPQGLAAR